MQKHKEYITKNDQEYRLNLWFRRDSEHGSGYVVTIIPVKRIHFAKYTLEESEAFIGYNKLLLPKERPHPAYFKQALTILNQEKEDLLQLFP